MRERAGIRIGLRVILGPEPRGWALRYDPRCPQVAALDGPTGSVSLVGCAVRVSSCYEHASLILTWVSPGTVEDG
jgi:hypothetical protein